MLNSHFRVRVISIGFILFFMSCAVLRVAAGDSDSTVPAYSPPRKGFWKSLYDLFSLHYESSNVIFSKETAYHNVTVEDDESGKRHLVFKPNHGSQGTILPNTPDALVPNFMKYSILALPALRHPPKSV
ncbi:MAG: hypothetical protein KAG97_03010, partial [Victivallales bacterium]|nr:hypothetical protein [Victivallales bacterium]